MEVQQCKRRGEGHRVPWELESQTLKLRAQGKHADLS